MTYQPLATSRLKAKSKGKKVARQDPEFDRERHWLLQKLQEDAEVAAQITVIPEDTLTAEGEGIECGCCFSSYPFVRSRGIRFTYIY